MFYGGPKFTPHRYLRFNTRNINASLLTKFVHYYVPNNLRIHDIEKREYIINDAIVSAYKKVLKRAKSRKCTKPFWWTKEVTEAKIALRKFRRTVIINETTAPSHKKLKNAYTLTMRKLKMLRWR